MWWNLNDYLQCHVAHVSNTCIIKKLQLGSLMDINADIGMLGYPDPVRHLVVRNYSGYPNVDCHLLTEVTHSSFCFWHVDSDTIIFTSNLQMEKCSLIIEDVMSEAKAKDSSFKVKDMKIFQGQGHKIILMPTSRTSQNPHYDYWRNSHTKQQILRIAELFAVMLHIIVLYCICSLFLFFVLFLHIYYCTHCE